MQGWGGRFRGRTSFPTTSWRLAHWGPKREGRDAGGNDQAKMSSHTVMALRWAEVKGGMDGVEHINKNLSKGTGVARKKESQARTPGQARLQTQQGARAGGGW